MLNSLEEADRNDLLQAVATMFTRAAASKISEISAERDSSNQAGTELPPVLPKQLVNTNMQSFVGIMNQQINRLTHSFSTEREEVIGTKFSNLLRVYRSDARLRGII